MYILNLIHNCIVAGALHFLRLEAKWEKFKILVRCVALSGCFFMVSIGENVDRRNYSRNYCKKAKINASSAKILRSNMKELGFTDADVRRVIADVSSVVGESWYDQSAYLEIKYVNYVGNKPRILSVRFSGRARVLSMSYELAIKSATEVKNEKRSRYNQFSAVVGRNGISHALNEGVPKRLKRNLLKFYNESSISCCPGDTIVCLYDSDCSILCAKVSYRGRSRIVVPFSTGASKYYYCDGQATKGKRIYFGVPVRNGRISSRYGPRFHPVLKRRKMHCGIDYAASFGTPIIATADGVVEFMGPDKGRGRTVRLRHGDVVTIYGHMCKFKAGLRVGKKVKKGDVIGYIGMTGLTTGPHVHYQVEKNGHHVRPDGFYRQICHKLTGRDRTKFEMYVSRLKTYF